MKTLRNTITLFLLAALLTAGSTYAQVVKDLQYYRTPGLEGVNVFEAPKEAGTSFDGLYVRVGGDFAIQFQGLSQSNDADNLIELSNNFTLPSANLNLDVQLAEGMRMHLRTYLSSKHHNESWVKGGYLQMDQLDFISEGFLAEIMEFTRFRFGMDEINYGDTHFRRSDNARAMYNPFVGNFIMDSFGTEPFGEVTVLNSGFIGVVGMSNGRLNQSPTKGDDGVAMYAKVGYDSQVNDDLRVRLTGSVYNSTDAGTRDYLYSGDRAGSRYYSILETEESANDFLPRFNPGFAYQRAFQVNPFVKFQGFELFGVVEVSQGGPEDAGSYTQLGVEALFRFGNDENFYVGGRYNTVNGEATDGGPSQEISRINVGGGWFLTNNVMAKVEYVTQSYDGAGFTGTFAGAEFSGFVLEAVVSF
jgi:hypothetical protein